MVSKQQEQSSDVQIITNFQTLKAKHHSVIRSSHPVIEYGIYLEPRIWLW